MVFIVMIPMENGYFIGNIPNIFRQTHMLPSGKHTKNYGKSPCLMGKSTISMAIFNSYASLPEGNVGKTMPIEPSPISPEIDIK